MANFLVLNHRSTRSYPEAQYLPQAFSPQPHYQDPRAGYQYNSKSYMNISPNNQFSVNVSPVNKNYRDQDEQMKFKEKSLLGSYGTRDPSFHQGVNMKVYKEDKPKISSRGLGIRPRQEMKSFLSQLAVITGSPNQKDWSRRQENSNHSQGISSLWRDPAEDKFKKHQKMNEWKQTLATQVQARQVQKQKEVEFQKMQEVKDEARLRKQLSDHRPNYEDKRAVKDHYSPQQKQINLAPFSYNTPKARDNYETLSNKQKASPEEFHHKPFYSPPRSNMALNSYIDQIKSDLLQGQRMFLEQMKGLKNDIENMRHGRSVTEKSLLSPTRNNYSLKIQVDSNDALDNYMSNYNYQRNFKGRMETSPSRSNASPKISSNPFAKFVASDEPEFDLDQFDSKGGFVSVKGQFVEVSDNDSLASEGLIKKPMTLPEEKTTIKPEKVLPPEPEKKEVIEKPIEKKEEPKEIVESIEEIIQIEEEEKKDEKISEIIIQDETSVSIDEKDIKDEEPEDTKKISQDNFKGQVQPKRIWIEKVEPDNENMFETMTSVFVNPGNAGSMSELKEGNKVSKENDVERFENMKRRNFGSFEAVVEEEEFKGDLLDKVEREQYKKRDIKRGNNQEPKPPANTKENQKKPAIPLKKRI